MSFFTDSFRFSASEADIHQHMKLSAVLRHMQDAATRHLDSLGYTYSAMMGRNQVFMLSKIEVNFFRQPAVGQMITAYTRPHPPKGAYFLRETSLAVDENLLCSSSSAWILVDFKTHQVLRPSSFDWNYPFDDVAFDGGIARRRLNEPQGVVSLGRRVIRYSDLDSNQHVNNAVYGDILFDYLPDSLLDGISLKSVTLLYEHEALLHDEIEIVGGQNGDSGWYLAGYRDDRRCFAATLAFDRKI